MEKNFTITVTVSCDGRKGRAKTGFTVTDFPDDKQVNNGFLNDIAQTSAVAILDSLKTAKQEE